MSKQFSFIVTSIREDIVTMYSDDLDWECQFPLDFFPDPFHLEENEEYFLGANVLDTSDIHEEEFGGFKRNPKKTKFTTTK